MNALLAVPDSDYSPHMVAVEKAELTDEADWIDRAQRSDSQAFESLYRMHIDKVYGLCLRMTGNVSEAEDCAQEAFIQAWNKLDRFRGDSAFATWLHRIAVNAVLGRMRKSKREQDRIQIDSLRNSYPDRREFKSHRVPGTTGDLAHRLGSLGFKTS